MDLVNYDNLKEGSKVTLKPEPRLFDTLSYRNFYSNDQKRREIAKKWGNRMVTVRKVEANLHYFSTLEAGNFPFFAIAHLTN